MSGTSNPTSDLLLQHVGWLRNLALSLVRDADVADDLAQETVVRALERAPTNPRSLRSWLATVLRNLMSERHRGDRNRMARERATARPDSLPPTDELVDRVQTQRRLADALLALDEPYRTSILLRFYEGLPPREIAKRQAVEVATVKSRIHRGLARLREHLDRLHGSDRRAWMCALLPLARQAKSATSAITIGGIALNTKLWIATAAAAAVAISTWLAWPDNIDGAGVDGLVAVDDEQSRRSNGGSGGGGTSSEPDAARERTARVTVPNASTPKPDRPSRRVAGRVLDGNGQGVPGLAIRAADADTPIAESKNAGFFELETSRENLRLEVGGDGSWMTVRAGSWNAGATIDPVIIAAPAIELKGSAIDELGRPLPDAKLSYLLPGNFRTRFHEIIDASYQPGWSATSKSGGSFELARVPAIHGASLQAACEGFEPAVIDLPLVSVDNIQIRLVRTDVAQGANALHGRVLRQNGDPASAARVAFGAAITRTNEHGFFAFDLADVGDAREIVAVEPGHQPGRSRAPTDKNEFVVLRLGPAALTMRGRVVDHAGEPAVGAQVMLANPTRFGVMGMLPLHTEGLTAGQPLPPLALESATWKLNKYEASTGSARPLRGTNAMVSYATTDSEGRFTLGGLADHAYRLEVVGATLRWTHRTDPIQAGTDEVEVRLPPPDTWPQLRGRVVTRHGDPVPGVAIVPYLPVFNEHVRVPGGRAHITRWFQAPRVICDEDGRFVIEDVPKEALQFYLISDQILPFYAGVEHVQDPNDVVVTVKARAHIDLELADKTFADAITVDDFKGAPAQILRMRADGHTNDRVLSLTDGKSGVVTVTSDAAVVNLLKGGEVVDSIPIRLKPGAVERIVRR